MTVQLTEPIASTASCDDAALVSGLRSGDHAAFEVIIDRHAPRMLAVARRMLGNDDDANDALQDAFISAFKACSLFEGGSQISTWLHRIVVNAALMKMRTRRRRPERSMEDLLPAFLDDGHRANVKPAWSASADELLERNETRVKVREAIERLPADYREVLMLRDLEELSTEHAAEVLGIKPGAVKTRLHRARQALRTLIEEEMVCLS